MQTRNFGFAQQDVYTPIRLNISSFSSTALPLLDLQAGTISQFKISKAGIVTVGGTTLTLNNNGAQNVQLVGGASILDFVQNAKFVARLTINGSQDFRLGADVLLGWGSANITTSAVGTPDTVLVRDGAANTIAQRNGTNAQAFNIYNTYTDASNFEKGFIRWTSGVLQIGVQVAGTGTSRAMSFFTAATARWTIDTFGAFMAAIDNTYDVGGSGVTRPRNGYFAGFISYAKQILTKTADYTVVSAETGCIYTNSGAAGQIIFTLPTWAAGLFYMFDVETAQNLRVVAPGTDTIRIAGSVSAGGGRIDNATVGGTVRLVATTSGKWLALFQEGTWTVT